MIKSLRLINFKSWKDTIFNFHKGVNAIIGVSDAGKSNTIKGIKWNSLNKPCGRIRSDWGGDTKVILSMDFDDFKNRNVYRVKTNTKNSYEYEPTKSGMTTYSSFGQDVPEDIKKFLNITAINFQNQHDPAFLLSDSSGEVARYLNKIVRLDKIDTANANINSTLRKERQDLQYEKGRQTELTEKLKDYVWLDEAEGCITKLEQFEASLFEKKANRRALAELRDAIIETGERIGEINDVVQYEDTVTRLIELDKKIGVKRQRFDDLTTLFDDITDTTETINDLKTKIDGWEKELAKLMPSVCPLCGNKIKQKNCKH